MGPCPASSRRALGFTVGQKKAFLCYGEGRGVEGRDSALTLRGKRVMAPLCLSSWDFGGSGALFL